MKSSRLIVLAALSVAALIPTYGQPKPGAPTIQAPGTSAGYADYTYCPYSSSTRSTSPSPAGGSCSTTSSTPSSA